MEIGRFRISTSSGNVADAVLEGSADGDRCATTIHWDKESTQADRDEADAVIRATLVKMGLLAPDHEHHQTFRDGPDATNETKAAVADYLTHGKRSGKPQ